MKAPDSLLCYIKQETPLFKRGFFRQVMGVTLSSFDILYIIRKKRRSAAVFGLNKKLFLFFYFRLFQNKNSGGGFGQFGQICKKKICF